MSTQEYPDKHSREISWPSFMQHWGIDATQLDVWQRLQAASQWLAAELVSAEHWLLHDVATSMKDDWSLEAYKSWLERHLAVCQTEQELMQVLRRLRKNAMLRLSLREVSTWIAIEDSCKEISYFADAVLDYVNRWVYQKLSDEFGVPIGAKSKQAQTLHILAMGKLGAFELNLSSDIDLIFVYPESGETQGGRRALPNQDFFTRVGRKIIALIDTVNADGFVFRVDMRLRPYGASGPLVANFDAIHIYYQQQGREWERYALIKARVVGEDTVSAQKLKALLQPFVYRKYVDYSVIDALRELKRSINAEVSRKRIENHIKLGKGGIREIEFIVQVFQLIYGGTIGELRRRSLLVVLPSLSSMGYLPREVVAELLTAYRFLRRLEHAVMMYKDEQTHILPSDDAAKAAVLAAMRFDHWDQLLAALNRYRDQVKQHFDDVITDDQLDSSAADHVLWPVTQDVETATELAAQLGYDEPALLAERLDQFAHSSRYEQIDIAVRTKVNRLLPALLDGALSYSNSTHVCLAVLKLLDSVIRRSAYIVLLLENAPAQRLLLSLFHKSEWVTQEIIQYPALLDDLVQLDSSMLNFELRGLQEQLDIVTAHVALDDLEAQMELLRRFKRSHMLKVAVCELLGTLPLMRVSDYLSNLATVIVNHALMLAYDELKRRHGVVEGCGDSVAACGFCAVGYGKLGGLELSHSSDLDMVFIFSPDKLAESDGVRPLLAQQYYTRMGQRLIHILTTNTASGSLYEVDMRLRPSGNSGAVVSSIVAYHKYQLESAWTWEHQALTRARAICGDDTVAQQFEECRKQILCRPRDIDALKLDVLNMRQKMLENLLDSHLKDDNAQEFHLKHSAGGIVDIEFMVQFAVLANASDYPSLAAFPDNIRILEKIAQSNLMANDLVQQLISAYKAYRSSVHTLSLQNKKPIVATALFSEHRNNVIAIWQHMFTS